MKINKIIRNVAFALILGSSSVSAVLGAKPASTPAAVTARNIREEFSNLFQNANNWENVPENGIIVVVFTVNDDGKIDIRKMESTDEVAANYVNEKLKGISARKFASPPNHLYKVKFSFEPL
jgi:hypothetical protein